MAENYKLRPKDLIPFFGGELYRIRNGIIEQEDVKRVYDRVTFLKFYNAICGVATVFGLIKGLEALVK